MIHMLEVKHVPEGLADLEAELLPQAPWDLNVLLGHHEQVSIHKILSSPLSCYFYGGAQGTQSQTGTPLCSVLYKHRTKRKSLLQAA